MVSIFKTVLRCIIKGKFKELIFRGQLFIIYFYGDLKYSIIKKINQNKNKIVTVNGSKMYVYLEDNGVSKELLLYNGREKFATEFMKKFLKEDEIIIEIGANIGYYVLLESTLVPGGKIFACEPLPLNRQLLKKNVELNNVKNIEIFPFAMSDQKKEQVFYIYDKLNWSSFRKNVEGKITSTMMVETMTLDNFVKDYVGDAHPTFMRMDVEGHEINIIKGALNTINQCDNLKIFIEIHPHLLSPEELEELIKIFKDNRFEIKAIFNECLPHISPYLDNKILDTMEEFPYGDIGNNYDILNKYLQLNKGTEVFFEKMK